MYDLYCNLSISFNAVCITDHWKLAPMKYNPFKDVNIFFGAEISCKLGDILAYGIKFILPILIRIPLKKLKIIPLK